MSDDPCITPFSRQFADERSIPFNAMRRADSCSVRKPLCIDCFCGVGGWSAGFLAEGWECIGFDIERHEYGNQRYPGQLVIQDVRTLVGSQFRDADCLVMSPPCQEFSWMAMPWSRGKQVARALRGEDEFPANYRGSRTVDELTALFDACFRIQREACEAAGRHIPLIVENVRGAIPWVGRSRWNFGSFHLWGDVPALMPSTAHKKVGGMKWYHPDDPRHVRGQGFNTLADRLVHTGSTKVPGFRFDGSGRSFQTASVEHSEGRKHRDPDGYERDHPEAFGWNAPRTSSKSPRRKAASAMIAKIPEPLARHIARVYKSRETRA